MKDLCRAAVPSLAAICFCALGPRSARADVKLPSIFGDHMVLQQEMKVPVWGTADPGEKVTVTVGDHTASATAADDGRWRVHLAPFPDGAAPTTMTVVGKNTLKFDDALIGDVWIASGQSNMWAPLSYAYNGKDEAAKAKDPELRLFLVAEKTALHPLTDALAPKVHRPSLRPCPRGRTMGAEAPGRAVDLMLGVRNGDGCQHRKILLIQRDQGRPSDFGRSCNKRIGNTHIVALAVSPAIQTASRRDGLVHLNQFERRKKAV